MVSPISSSLVTASDKRTRFFHVFQPSYFDPEVRRGAIIALHGGGGTGWGFNEWITADTLRAEADLLGWYLVCPEAWNGNWNDGRGLEIFESQRPPEVPDVEFIKTLIRKLISPTYGVDPKKIYIVGLSNGAMMSYRLAQEISDLVSVFGCIVAGMPSLRAEIPFKRPCSMLICHGEADPLMPIDGGDLILPTTHEYHGNVLSHAQTVEVAKAQAGLSGSIAKVWDFPNKPDGTSSRRLTWSGGQLGTEVVSIVSVGAGHTWANLLPPAPVPMHGQYLSSLVIGEVARDFSMSKEFTALCQRHVLQG